MSYYAVEPSQNLSPRTGPGALTTNYANATGGNYPHLEPLQRPEGGWRPREVQRNETVQGQMEDLNNTNSRYLQMARQRAQAASASQGRLFSGIASGQAEKAGIEASLPIASQDAAWFGRTSSDNMDAENKFLLQEADLANRLALSQAENSTRFDLAQIDRDTRLTELDRRQVFDREMALGERDWRTGERVGGEGFQSRMADTDRSWRTGERVAGDGMRREEWQFNAGQSDRDRAWRTGERQASEQWQGGQTQADRDFRGTQADRDRTYHRENSWIQYQQSVQTNQANLEASILSNPNLTPAQAQAALANMRQWYATQLRYQEYLFQQPLPPIFTWRG